MISYKDMTFCRGDGCTKFATCPRALTPAVELAAKAWWGSDNAPLNWFMEPKKLKCYTSKEDQQ